MYWMREIAAYYLQQLKMVNLLIPGFSKGENGASVS